MTTWIDTNVCSALWDLGHIHNAAAADELSNAVLMGTLKMSGCAYAEFFAGPNRPAVEVSRFLREAEIEIAWEVGEGTWRLAAERFSVYAARRREDGNEPKRFVADFLIGAQAVLDGGRLLTFDRRTYAKAFPELTLVGTDAVQPHN